MSQPYAPQENLKIFLSTSVSSDAGMSLYISIQYNVLYNLIFFLLYDSPASDLYYRRFGTLSVPTS